jgi:glutathione S-transferase
MPSIKYYGPRSGSSLRGHWTLAEAGVEYEWVQIDMKSDERKRPEFLKMNPMGQVPVFIEGDTVLTESVAISHHVAKKYKPELLGNPDEEAQALRWAIWGLLNPQKAMLMWAVQRWRNTNDETIIATAREDMEKYFAILDEWLASHEFIAGTTFTFGDICVSSTVYYTSYCDNYDYSKFTNISRWMKLVTSRPSYAKAKAE